MKSSDRKIHEEGRDLKSVIFGIEDGTVNTLGIVLGTTAAGASAPIIMVAALAGMVAEAISMAVGSYLSTKSELEVHERLMGKLKDHGENPYKVAGLFGVASLAGIVSIIPYTLLPPVQAAPWAVVLSLGTLFSTGALKTKVTKKSWFRSGTEMLILGGLAALAGYLIGVLFSVPV